VTLLYTARCVATLLTINDQIDRGYTRLAVRRLNQAQWLRNKRRLNKIKEADALTRLRALESIIHLQSAQGTSLQTLLLTEGMPPMSARPSTSTAPDPPSTFPEDWRTIAAQFQSEGSTQMLVTSRQPADDRQSTEVIIPPMASDRSRQQVDCRQSTPADRQHSSTQMDRQSTSTETRSAKRSTPIDSRQQSEGQQHEGGKQSTVHSHQSTVDYIYIQDQGDRQSTRRDRQSTSRWRQSTSGDRQSTA